MASVIKYAKLNLPVNIKALQAETEKIINDKRWFRHFNYNHYNGKWEVLALRSPGGKADGIIPDLMNDTEFKDTDLMAQLPSIQNFISGLLCPVMSVRLLNLKARGIIKQHRDPELNFEKGEARIHVPVFTNSGVEFYVDNERVEMKEGESWYINANELHRVSNLSSSDRIHLVIDCQVNEWLSNIFNQSKKVFVTQKDDEITKMIQELRLLNTETSNKLANDLWSSIKQND